MADSTEVAVARVINRYAVFRMAAWVVIVAASVIPLRWGVLPIADTLAGKRTNVTVSVTITIALSVVLGGAALTLWIKNKAQRRELIALRERCIRLEAELDAIKNAGGQP